MCLPGWEQLDDEGFVCLSDPRSCVVGAVVPSLASQSKLFLGEGPDKMWAKLLLWRRKTMNKKPYLQQGNELNETVLL